jgi:O-antigen ligase
LLLSPHRRLPPGDKLASNRSLTSRSTPAATAMQPTADHVSAPLQPPSSEALTWAGWIAGLALACPFLIARSAVPDTVFYNQVAALFLWGASCLMFAPIATSIPSSGQLTLGIAATACLVLQWRIGGRLAEAGVMASALVLLTYGFIDASGRRTQFAAWATAWWVAGLLSVGVGLMQFALPGLIGDHEWVIAASTTPGRAVGNMRQPNHLSTVLLCACVATAWLWQTRKLSDRVATLSLGALVLGVALTASRTGGLSLALLLVWALVDRSLPKRARIALALSPLLYLVLWGVIAAIASFEHESFYGSQRLAANTDISSSRFAIWSNAFELIVRNPWFGVGWSNFNFAWTFTPFPDRPVAFFDHTHNILLQLLVETGVPTTLVVIGGLCWAVWRARRALDSSNDQCTTARAAFMMLAVLGVHSMLEYPLWYAYFLLPAAWVFGAFLGSTPLEPDADSRGRRTSLILSGVVRAGGVLMMVGSIYATWDHLRIETIFTPPEGAAPLDVRIAQGRHSLLFGHHADYAAVTVDPGDTRLASFRRPLHQLVDVRLLIAYIEALKERGENEKALYAAQRLREFHRADAQEFFSECTPANPAPPFQCDTRPVPLTWRDMDPQ